MTEPLPAFAQAALALNEALLPEGLTLKHLTYSEGVWYCGLKDATGHYYSGPGQPDPLSTLTSTLAKARRGPPARHGLLARRDKRRPAMDHRPPQFPEFTLNLDDLL